MFNIVFFYDFVNIHLRYASISCVGQLFKLFSLDFKSTSAPPRQPELLRTYFCGLFCLHASAWRGQCHVRCHRRCSVIIRQWLSECERRRVVRRSMPWGGVGWVMRRQRVAPLLAAARSSTRRRQAAARSSRAQKQGWSPSPAPLPLPIADCGFSAFP